MLIGCLLIKKLEKFAVNIDKIKEKTKNDGFLKYTATGGKDDKGPPKMQNQWDLD